MNFKTGLIKAPKPPSLRFGAYLKATALPPLPATFGHYNLIPAQGWGMLGNDVYGDCTIAGGDHCTMLWNKIAGRAVNFTVTDAEEDYFAITGGADTGADMVTAAQYWQKTGLRDNTGQRHQIAAYLQVNAGEIDMACYLFDAVGLGVMVGDAEDEAYASGQPWLTPNPAANEYHYVPLIGRDATYRKVVTWGHLQDIGPAWMEAQLVEVVAVVSQENLINGKSAEGFDYAALTADLKELSS